MKYIYSIEGMTCNGCRNSVQQKLEELFPDALVDVVLEESKIIIEDTLKPKLSELQEQLPEKYVVSEYQLKNEIKTPIQQNSKLMQLKPLFLIFGYIIIASFLMHFREWNTREFMLDFMGLFFIVFSFFKFLDLRGFSESFKMYDPLAKVIPFYGAIYPFIEVVLGIAFLFRFQVLTVTIITIVLLGITTIGVTKSLLNKEEIQCACLGTTLNLPMTQATFIENSIMIIMGVLMII